MKAIFKRNFTYVLALAAMLCTIPLSVNAENTNLADGTYAVSIELWKSDADAVSMGNSAFEQRGKLVVEEGNAVLHTAMKGMEVGTLTGYVTELSVLNDANNPEDKTTATVVSTDDTTGNPTELSFPVVMGEEFTSVEVKIPVMESLGQGTQTARMKIDYTSAVSFVQGDKTALTAAVQSTLKFTKSNYTADSYQVMQDAVSSASVVVNTHFASQDEVDEKTDEVVNAIDNLVFNRGNGRYTVDGYVWHASKDQASMATGIIESTEILVENGSVKVIVNAQPLVVYGVTSYMEGLKYHNGTEYVDAEITGYDADGNVTQAAFTLPKNVRYTGINLGYNGRWAEARLYLDFETAKEIVTKDALSAKVTQAKAIAKGNYTDATYQVLTAAIAKAETVVANISATQIEVDAMLTELVNAISGLKENVKEAAPTIKLNKTTATIYTQGTNNTVKLTTTVTGASSTVTWKSSNTAIAAVKSGTVTGKKAGKATITATANGVSKTCTVTVKTASLSLNKTKATIYTKGTTKVTLKATVKGASSKVTWKSSNTKIATVKSGVVTAKKAGTATITATANGISKTCKITVKNATLTVKKTALTVKKGKTVKISATVTPGSKIAYKTSNKKIATVTSKGVVKGIKKGKTTITVSSNGIKKTVKITVK